MRAALPALALLTASLVATAPTTALGAADGSRPMCQGHRATKVGTPGATVMGTKGRDVIVSNSANSVQTSGGDDVVCLTGRHPGTTGVGLGDGDDLLSVDYRGSYREISVGTGPGDDTVLGRSGKEHVDLGARGDRNTIALGGGDDTVAPLNYGRSEKLRDVIRLGAGDDQIQLYGGVMTKRAVLDGGDGRDLVFAHRLQYELEGPAVTAGTAIGVREDGRQVLTWQGFESYELAGARQLSFDGTDRAESVVTDEFVGRFSARMGGGRDIVAVGPLGPSGDVAPFSVNGGPDRDRIEVDVDSMNNIAGTTTVDLAARTATVQDPRYDAAGSVAGFEDATAEGRFVTLRGDDGPNHLTLPCLGRTLVAAGAGSDDLLTSTKTNGNGPGSPICRNGVELRGGDGDDHLLGSYRDDELSGGAGRDTADGRGARDSCVAERRVSC